MSKALVFSTLISFLLFALFAAMNLCFQKSFLLAAAITFGTAAYHLAMRQLVAFVVNKVMNNRADYHRKWYQLRGTERRLYEILKVKSWKSKVPSYQPDSFSPSKHTWDEIAQAMCQAEVVHEIIVVLSFLPMLMSVEYGAFYVFFITSVCAAFVDLIFVIVQRYNRPRVVKLCRGVNYERSKNPYY